MMFSAFVLPVAVALAFPSSAQSLPSTPAGHPAAAGGTYVFRQDRVYSLVRLNGAAVPAVVEFASTAGSRHWVKMDEAILRLRRDGTFSVSARFYRELLQAGRPAPRGGALRLLNDGAHGRYVVRGDTVVLNVAKRRDSPAGTAYARMTGDRLRIRHTLRDGNLRHNVDIELKVDPTIW